MPSYGESQKPAGVVKQTKAKTYGESRMISNNTNVKTTLVIDKDCEYKGNAVLNANK